MRNENNAGVDLDSLPAYEMGNSPVCFAPGTYYAAADVAKLLASASQVSKDAGGLTDDEIEEAAVDYYRAMTDSIDDVIGFARAIEARVLSAGAAAKTEQVPMKRAGWFVHEGGAWVATSSDDPRATVLYRGEASASAAGAGSEQRMVEVLAALEELSRGAEIAKSEEWVNARASVVLAALARAPLPEQDDDACDAARYRWLREQRGVDGDLPIDGDVWVVQFSQPKGAIPELRCAGFGDKLDRSVDLAMSASRPDDKGEKA
jgi:hypothetical protein